MNNNQPDEQKIELTFSGKCQSMQDSAIFFLLVFMHNKGSQ